MKYTKLKKKNINKKNKKKKYNVHQVNNFIEQNKEIKK